MVASAAMAGVPLLNGFLSKEMFFAEKPSRPTPTPGWTRPRLMPPCSAAAFAVTYSIRLIHSYSLGAPEQLPSRAARAAVLDAVPGHVPGGRVPRRRHYPWADHRAVPARRRVSVLGTATPQYSLAVWHGFNLRCDERSRAGRRAACSISWQGDYLNVPKRPPLLGRIKGTRFRTGHGRDLVAMGPPCRGDLRHKTSSAADAPARCGRDRCAHPIPLFGLGLRREPATHGGSRIRRALVRRHGLRGRSRPPGQVPPPRGSRPARRGQGWYLRDFVWFSAPDLAATQLPRRDRHDGPDPARPALAPQENRGVRSSRAASSPACAVAAICRWPS